MLVGGARNDQETLGQFIAPRRRFFGSSDCPFSPFDIAGLTVGPKRFVWLT